MLAQHRVGGDIALVAHDHPGGHGQEVGPVVPLLPLGGPDVLVGGEHGDLLDPEDLGEGLPQAVVPGDRESVWLVAGGQGPAPQVPVEVGVEHERGRVDHGHHRVEVHEGVTVGELDGHHLRRLSGGEQGPGHGLDGHGGRAFTHADQDGAVADDVDVATLDVRRLVVVVVSAVVRGEVRAHEQRVVLVDGPGVQGLPPPGGHGHRIDGHTPVDPAGIVPLEELIGQRGQDEVIGPEHVPPEAVGPHRVEIGLQDPTDEELRQLRPVQVIEQVAHRADQRRTEVVRRAHAVEHEGAPFGELEGLGQQSAVVVHGHALVA